MDVTSELGKKYQIHNNIFTTSLNIWPTILKEVDQYMSNIIEIYCITISKHIKKIPYLEEYLSYEEIMQSNKLYSQNLKNNFIISKVYLKIILSKILDLEVKNLIFKHNHFGKPYLDSYDIYFNLSHSGDYIYYAFSNENIGIDIEFHKQDNNIENIVNMIFHKNEIKQFQSISYLKKKHFFIKFGL